MPSFQRRTADLLVKLAAGLTGVAVYAVVPRT